MFTRCGQLSVLIVPGISSAENFFARKHLLVKEVTFVLHATFLVAVLPARTLLLRLGSVLSCSCLVYDVSTRMNVQGFRAGLQDT